MSVTRIEYCDITINPIVGCSKISEGCKNCYAEKFAWRLKCMGIKKYQDVVDRNGWTGKFGFDMTVFNRLPRKHKIIFICSMGDLFHPNISHYERNQVFEKIALHSQHTYLLLTKRPEIALDFDNWRYERRVEYPYPPWGEHIWLGVTAENQKHADERIPILLRVPTKNYWVSLEPLLGPIDLSWPALNELFQVVVVGPETGPGARPYNPDWIKDLYDQCRAAWSPFFDKRKEGWLAREFPNFAEWNNLISTNKRKQK